MKRLTATTLALVAATGTSVMAQDVAVTEDAAEVVTTAELGTMQGELIRTRDITDSPIYSLNSVDENWAVNTTYDAVGADWNRIGEIEDLVLDQSGQLQGIVAEIGGFLDIGDKHVLISVSDVNLVAADEYAYVTRLTEEELEAQEDVDEGWWD